MGLTSAMVEVSDPLIGMGISNSPVSSSLFATLCYGREWVTKCPFWYYPPILFFSVDKVLKSFLVLVHLFNGLR